MRLSSEIEAFPWCAMGGDGNVPGTQREGNQNQPRSHLLSGQHLPSQHSIPLQREGMGGRANLGCLPPWNKLGLGAAWVRAWSILDVGLSSLDFILLGLRDAGNY